MKFFSSQKIKIRALSSHLNVLESFLTIYFWNTGLITLELFLSSHTRPNKSYLWLKDVWKLKHKSGTLRDLGYIVIQGLISTLQLSNILKEDFILSSEPSMYFLKFFPPDSDSSSFSDPIYASFKNADNSLQPNWFLFDFQTSQRFIFFNPSREYFFLQDSLSSSLSKTVRTGLLFTIQFIVGSHLWVNHPKILNFLTNNPDSSVIQFFLVNLNPQTLSSNFLSVFHKEPYFSFLQAYFDNSSYIQDYSSLQTNIANKLPLLSSNTRGIWEQASKLYNSDIISDKIASLQKVIVTESYSHIKNDALQFFTLSVAFDLFLNLESNIYSPSEWERKLELSLSTVTKKSQEIRELARNSQPLPFPYSELKGKYYFHYKELSKNNPLIKLVQKGFLIPSKSKRGRPRHDYNEPGIFMLNYLWRDREKIIAFYKIS